MLSGGETLRNIEEDIKNISQSLSLKLEPRVSSLENYREEQIEKQREIVKDLEKQLQEKF